MAQGSQHHEEDGRDPDRQWHEVVAIASRYDGWPARLGVPAAIGLADRIRFEFCSHHGFTASAMDLATSLAFECRSYLHCGLQAQDEDLSYLVALSRAVGAHPPEI